MSTPVRFPGANRFFGPPPGYEEVIRPIEALQVGAAMISCWELTDEEINEIILRRRVYVAVLSGSTFFPTYVGSPSDIAGVPPQYKDQLQ